jgi:hypothetical protein
MEQPWYGTVQSGMPILSRHHCFAKMAAHLINLVRPPTSKNSHSKTCLRKARRHRDVTTVGCGSSALHT